MKSMNVTFWSGVETVTGANFLLTYNNTKILIDCGMLQGTHDAEEENNKDFAYVPNTIDYLFITHAHIDHIGRIPKLVKDGFAGVIYSSPETKAISEIMLKDAARIAEFSSKDNGTLPPYNMSHVEQAISNWRVIPYHKKTEIVSGLSVTLYDAGHILGSSMYLFEGDRDSGKNTKILFTGDLGNSPSKLLRDTEYVAECDYVVMDSVYGDRNHEPKDVREARFKETLLEAIKKKGAVLIPAFSLERTQTILYELNELIESKIIPTIPVFVDSPLAISLTEIYEKIHSLYNDSVQNDISSGDHIFSFPRLKETLRVFESEHISKEPNPKIIIAGSGMSTAGRILRHEELYLPDPKTTLILMGYQAPGTIGRSLEEGQKDIYINDKKVTVKAQIVKIDGYSGHKDSDHLVEFIGHTSPEKIKTIFVVMGEQKSSLFLAQRLFDAYRVKAICPARGKVYDL